MRKKKVAKNKERRQEFLRHYVECGDHVRAAELAGYEYESRQLLVNEACRLKRQMSAEIEEAMRERFGGTAIKAANVMEELMLNSLSDGVKLNAAKDLLDRGGYKPIDRTQEVKEEASHEELVAKLKMLVGEEAAKVLLGEKKPEKAEEPEMVPVEEDQPLSQEFLN